MASRFTYDFVKKALKAAGYILLSKTYENNQQYLDVQCGMGHNFKLRFGNFRNRDWGCPTCRHENYYNKVKTLFENEGFKLITPLEEYKHTDQKVKFECPRGHIYKQRPRSFEEGHRCWLCGIEDRKADFETIKRRFKAEGYTVLSNKYVNSHQKIKCICPEGHKFAVSTSNFFSRNSRCPKCQGCYKHTIEDVRNIFAAMGYRLLSTEYVNSHTLLDCVCPNGHEWQVRLSNFKNSNARCMLCVGNAKPVFEDVKAAYEAEGYILLSKKYKNAKSKLTYICPAGHVRNSTWGNWVSGRRCRVCSYVEMSGPNHPFWKGGISCEPYCSNWTKEFKEYVKDRDNYNCMNPYCSSNNTEDLAVHHVDYNKKNCDLMNLITLCRSCNAKANFDREWHTSWYQAILSRRYGYEYGPVAQGQSGAL